MGTVKAVCVSEKKGTAKMPVSEAELIEDHGIRGDAHAGPGHRQISVLAYEAIEEFKRIAAGQAPADDAAAPETATEADPGEELRSKCYRARRIAREIRDGAFGENLIVEGCDPASAPVGTRFRAGSDAVIEITQFGKDCHTGCAIAKLTGSCIMPYKGVFARVVRGGTVRPGDGFERLPFDPETPFTAAVITLSDKGAAGLREDRSGPLLAEMLEENGFEVIERKLLPDGEEALSAELVRLSDQRRVSLILTTGGTGFSERDLTPETTLKVCERAVPGIPEAMRRASLEITPRAMLSRGVAGIRKKTLIINLPGSPKAAKENLQAVLPALGHGLGILRGTEGECAMPEAADDTRNG